MLYSKNAACRINGTSSNTISCSYYFLVHNQIYAMTKMYAWHHKGGLGGGMEVPPFLHAYRIDLYPDDVTHKIFVCVGHFERQNNRKHVITQHARMREWVKQYENFCDQYLNWVKQLLY